LVTTSAAATSAVSRAVDDQALSEEISSAVSEGIDTLR
jgi:hypothetical protein